MENITNEQRELLERLRSVDPSVEVSWDEMRGVASSIRGRFGFANAANPEAGVAAFLDAYGPLVGPTNLPQGLLLLRSERDDIRWEHLLYAYMVAGEIELYGAKVAFHLAPDGVLMAVESNLWRDLSSIDPDPQVSSSELQALLLQRVEALSGFDRLREVEGDQPAFPLTDPPRLVVYPSEGAFRLAWTSYGYSDADELEGNPVEAPYLAHGHIFVDAATGERILFAPTRKRAETACSGTGTAVTPLTGGNATRTLNVVRIDNGNTYRLQDTTHKRKIITYDVACSTGYDDHAEISLGLQAGKLTISEDSDGDDNWSRLPADTTAAERTAGQQPEVDAHHFVRQQYEWYEALDGRIGWDDRRHAIDPITGKPIPDRYPDPPVPDLPLHILAHCRMFGSCQSVNAYEDLDKSGGKWVFWLAFADADHATYDYMAGSRWLVAHEYQHAVTDCSFRDSNNNPGLDYNGWLGAVHEGLSDVFASLSSEDWRSSRDIRRATPAVDFRTIAYPRDWAAYDPNKLDHFDDRTNTTDFYARGAILAHCAYLMGKGGVHQRNGRTAGAVLIPVPALGSEVVGGKSVLKAARIWYRALDKHSSAMSNDDTSFRTLREACKNAASEIYLGGSAEYYNTILAFYAVGLHPTDPPNYGADVTFLRWGIDWDLSRAYVGLTSPDFSSLDLFINNGGASEWNALINVDDPATGQPTQYENTIYCRVRNVGDLDALNVEVEFEYAKAGTATWKWEAVRDKSGAPQKPSLGVLKKGESNFADSAQNSPPGKAAVKWCIPPLAVGEKVNHFCLRARVKADNDVNPYNNEVQSNIAYMAYSPSRPSSASFVCGNPPKLERVISLDLQLKSSLPDSWRVDLQGVRQGEMLKPGEERLFDVVIDMPPGADKALELPLDGDMRGMMSGDLTGRFTGSLTDTSLVQRNRLAGQFSGLLDGIGSVCGSFDGTIDLRTGWLTGTVDGPHPDKIGVSAHMEIKARLRPWRRVEVSQWVDDQLLGGMTVQVQLPGRRGRFGYRPPPTDTQVVVHP